MTIRLREMLPVNRPIPPGMIAIAGCLATIISLLANKPGWAIVIASLILPGIALVTLWRRDVFEREPVWGALAALGWGVVTGIIAGVLAAAISAEWWVSGATLHVGAGGFGGLAAKLAGRPGFGVLLLNGIVLPALAVAVAAVGPFALRRFAVFRNEVMDGLTLGMAAGCGLATGLTIVFVWPLIGGASVTGDSVADWTALITSVLVTRPVTLGLAAGFICTGIWHASISQKSINLILPAAIGLGGAILFNFGDLLIQPSGTRLELLWQGVIAIGMAAAARLLLTRVIHQDRATLAMIQNRVICANCGKSTPLGTFCAVCGSRLNMPDAPLKADEELEPDEPATMEIGGTSQDDPGSENVPTPSG